MINKWGNRLVNGSFSLYFNGEQTREGIVGNIYALINKKFSFRVFPKGMEAIKANVKDYSNETEVRDYLVKLLSGEAGDRSGKIYGLGHAVYTISDPRAVLLKQFAEEAAEKNGRLEEFKLLESVERLGIPLIMEQKKLQIPMCANVDLYSGLVYSMLGIPAELLTPLFAIARIAGWCAHRMEEALTCNRLIRPGYKSAVKPRPYVAIGDR